MTLPQLDISDVEPSHISPTLAHLVMGRFTFMGMPHPVRVMRLYSLIELYRTVRRIGELEHTSDWDWRITVIHTSGYAGTDHEDIFCDTIILPYTTEPNDYTTDFARWTTLQVEELNHNGTDRITNVPIDEILTIDIGYDT